MQLLLKQLACDYPQLTFTAGNSFYWCPSTQEVFYKVRPVERASDAWSLLHEVSHGLLSHSSYRSDFELIRLEAAAWQHACELAKKYAVTIDDEHVQDCLDTYRDWLYQRCLCPACGTQSLQTDNSGNDPLYQCFNCSSSWQVGKSLFCRPYRRAKTKQPALVFQDTV